MNKQDIINSLNETIHDIESMPPEKFAEKWMEVNDYYEKLNLDNNNIPGSLEGLEKKEKTNSKQSGTES